jgi:hypothetical protein
MKRIVLSVILSKRLYGDLLCSPFTSAQERNQLLDASLEEASRK